MATNHGQFGQQQPQVQLQQQPMFVSASGQQAGGQQQQHLQLAPGTAQALQAGNKPGQNFNLDEIFGDCFFTPEGETVFLSDQQRQGQGQSQQVGSSGSAPSSFVPSTEGQQPAQVASRLDPATGQYVPVQMAGGIATTHLDQPGVKATVMGPAAGGQPQQQRTNVTAAPRHHMGYITPSAGGFLDVNKKRRTRPGERKMSDQQKVERRYIHNFFPYERSRFTSVRSPHNSFLFYFFLQRTEQRTRETFAHQKEVFAGISPAICVVVKRGE
jgi:hypothetical protein